MIYLKKFENHSAYEAAESGLILPNVSLCVNENEVHYKPYVEPETRVVAKFNVTSTSNPTQIGYIQYTSGFSEIEIDGVVQPSVVSAYTFDTLGEHTVKYTLTDPTTIGGSAFRNCSGLTSINIPDSVTSIGSSAFYECTSLTSIDIPNNITTIGGLAFGYCSGLTSCTIGSGITYIGWVSFNSCSNLTNITINATTPPTLEKGQSQYPANDTFNGSYPICVPSDSVDAYKSAQYWDYIASRIQAIP